MNHLRHRVGLVGRVAECDRLDGLLSDLEIGKSRALVIRGDAGVGKTALLGYLNAAAVEARVTRVSGYESEMELPFSGLHQLLAPMILGVDRLPIAQSVALRCAFGMDGDGSPKRFMVGLAALGLLSGAASGVPLLCLIDDADCLDGESAAVLAFIARRLGVEGVGMVFTERLSVGRPPTVEGVAELVVPPLGERDARELLGLVAGARLTTGVAKRILADAGGNPLALRELPAALTPAQLRGTEMLPRGLPLTDRLNASFLRRVRTLPKETQLFLLIAAAENDASLVWKAAARLTINVTAADDADAEGLLHHNPDLSFRHPLIRSAVYDASSSADRRRVHQVLSDVSDPLLDPDRRAWHRAAAALAPDEAVASELERAVDRSRRRGGHPAAAALLERAARLTPTEGPRGKRFLAAAESHLAAGSTSAAGDLIAGVNTDSLDSLASAQAQRLHGVIAFALGDNSRTLLLLAEAAASFESVDLRLARDTYLEALEAVTYGGPPSGGPTAVEVGRSAQAAPRPVALELTAADDLLDGYAALVTDGHAAAVPALRRAIDAFQEEADIRWIGLALSAAWALFDDNAIHSLATRRVSLARETAALTVLTRALGQLAGYEVLAGRFDSAEASLSEAREIAAATGNPGIIGRHDAGAVMVAAWRGHEADARALAADCIRDATSRSVGIMAATARWMLAVLENSLGNYEASLTAAQAASEHPWVGIWALPEVIESAARVGQNDTAAAAVTQLAGIVGPADTSWGLGLLTRSQALVTTGPDADELYEASIDHLERSTIVPELARTRLLYGEWLHRHRRRRDARTQLSMAHQTFEAIGAEAFARRAGAVLRTAGGKPTTTGMTDPTYLTPQEARIAQLVRDGLSNQDIGAHLFVSPRTVEYHLHKVYQKLNLTSRTQLASAMSPHRDEQTSPHGSREP